MHLIYFDESGQTGNNLRDVAQPVFVLGALVVPETTWLAVEKDLQTAIDKHFPAPRPADFEIHATEISNPRKGFFKQFPIPHRLEFRDSRAIPLIEPLIHVGDERFRDINAWVTTEQKKGRPGN